MHLPNVVKMGSFSIEVQLILDTKTRRATYLVKNPYETYLADAVEVDGVRFEAAWPTWNRSEEPKEVRTKDGWFVEQPDGSLVRLRKQRRAQAKAGDVRDENVGGGDGQPG